ncbi:hypothetical protein ABIE13_000203 [Ottowia thiooxydans]|uniref:Uncharacterized protein n=1 Tax=Ottowia thiooxydans TaxID=219182 RepID=A0ABV2Q256_9BURK
MTPLRRLRAFPYAGRPPGGRHWRPGGARSAVAPLWPAPRPLGFCPLSRMRERAG